MNIKCFQCANGKDFNNESFKNFCNICEMTFRFSCPYTSLQNGKVECKLRIIKNLIQHYKKIVYYLRNVFRSYFFYLPKNFVGNINIRK